MELNHTQSIARWIRAKPYLMQEQPKNEKHFLWKSSLARNTLQDVFKINDHLSDERRRHKIRLTSQATTPLHEGLYFV